MWSQLIPDLLFRHVVFDMDGGCGCHGNGVRVHKVDIEEAPWIAVSGVGDLWTSESVSGCGHKGVVTCMPRGRLAPLYVVTSSRSTAAVMTSTSSRENWAL